MLMVSVLLCVTFACGGAARSFNVTDERMDAKLNNSVEVEWPEKEGEQLLKDGTRATKTMRSWSRPTEWTRYGYRFFIFINRPDTWPQAEHYCLSLGANLASVHSPGEEQFLRNLVRTATGGFFETWIGGNDAVQSFVWFWSDGSTFDYQNWARGEPNNYRSQERCIEMNWSVNHAWNDVNCQSTLPFICATRPCSFL